MKRILLLVLVVLSLVVGTMLAVPKISSHSPAVTVAATPQSPAIELIAQFGGTAKTVVVQGNLAYMGVGSSLKILDVSEAANPFILGQLLLPGLITAVLINGNHAYVAADGFYIIDIAEPSVPVIIGDYNIPDATNQIHDLAAIDNYAYLATTNGILTLDISSPATPTKINDLQVETRFHRIKVAGSHLYALSNDLHIFDIADPATPALSSNYETSGYSTDITILNEYAYIGWLGFPPQGGSFFGGVEIVNITDPTTPQHIAQYSNSSKAIHHVAMVGNHLYLSLGDQTIEIINVANVTQPFPETEYFLDGIAQNIYVLGNYAYVPLSRGALNVLDITNPVEPVKVGDYPGSLERYQVITTAGSYAFAAGSRHFALLDITDPYHPLFVGSHTAAEADDYYFFSYYKIFAEDDILFLPWYRAWHHGDESAVSIITIQEPTEPTFITNFAVNNTWRAGAGQIDDLLVQGNYVYLLGSYVPQPTTFYGLRVFDITNLASPAELVAYPLSSSIRKMALNGDILYVAAQDDGLLLVDVSTPSDPVDAGSYLMSGSVYDVAIVNQYLYLLLQEGSLLVLDISDPLNPQEVAQQPIPNEAKAMVIEGHYVYIQAEMDTVYVVNIFSPTEPSLVGSHDDFPVNSMAVSNQTIYGTADYEGMYIYAFTSPTLSAVSGQVLQANNLPFDDEVLVHNSQNMTTTTAMNGRYQFDLDYSGVLTITPSLDSYVFSPPARAITLPTNSSGHNFTILSPPVTATLTPGITTSLTYTDTQGLPTHLSFPPMAVTQTTTITLTPTVATSPINQTFTGHAFDIAAVPHLSTPFSITIHYSNADVRLVSDIEALTLYWWNGTDWIDAATTCIPDSSYDHDTINHVLTVTACNTGHFALFGPTHSLHLPIIHNAFPLK